MQQAPGYTAPQQESETAHRSCFDRLAGYTGPAEAFIPRLLESLCEAAGAKQAALLAGGPEYTGMTPTACHPNALSEHQTGSAWLERIHRDTASAPPQQPLLLPLRNNTGQQVWAQIALLPLPQASPEQPASALALFVETGEAAAGTQALLHLQHAAHAIEHYRLSHNLRQRNSDMRALSRAMRAMDAINREARFRPAVIAMCNELADAYQASRAAVGFLSGQWVKLRGMSHTEDINRKMQVVQDLEAAMEEAIDQDSEVLAPQDEQATTINRQARLYTDKHGPSRLCILPLRIKDKPIGALSVEWPSDHEIRGEEVESLRLAANLFTARLHQQHISDRWFGARMATSLRQTAALAVGPKHTWAKLVAIAGLALILFAFLFKGDDTIDGAFTVETTQRQIITAPFEATLLSVGEGIEVNKSVIGLDQAGPGQPATILAQLDTSELRVERAALDAQIADFSAQADAARGENDLAGVEVAMANVRRLQAQAERYDYRIARSVLTSPTSGVVIEGDLQQRINGPLDKGEVLFEIAPIDAMRAELLVPANRVGDVRARQEHPDNPSTGELASASHPGDFIRFTVERIEPEAEVVDGKNIFRVRVSLDRITPWTRPGVEGEAKIHVARRSYAHLWTRDAVNWVRMKLWL